MKTELIELKVKDISKTNKYTIQEWIENSHASEKKTWMSLMGFLNTWEELCLPSLEDGSQGSQYCYSDITFIIESSPIERRNIVKELKRYNQFVKISIF